MYIRLAFLTVALVSLGGCGLMPRPYSVTVDEGSFGQGLGQELPKSFAIVSLSSSEASDRMQPLVEQRLHDALRTFLVDEGWFEASEEDASVIVGGFASISTPQSVPYTYSVPTWGQTGVRSSYTTGYVSSYGNYSATTTYTPEYGVTGYRTGVGVRTVFTRRMNVVLVSTSNPENGWSATMVSTGTSGDIRKVIPAMVLAMGRVFLEDRGEAKEVRVSGFARSSFAARLDAGNVN